MALGKEGGTAQARGPGQFRPWWLRQEGLGVLSWQWALTWVPPALEETWPFMWQGRVPHVSLRAQTAPGSVLHSLSFRVLDTWPSVPAARTLI